MSISDKCVPVWACVRACVFYNKKKINPPVIVNKNYFFFCATGHDLC